MKLLQRLNEEGMTIVMVTHSPECAQSADRIIRVVDGKVAAEMKNSRPEPDCCDEVEKPPVATGQEGIQCGQTAPGEKIFPPGKSGMSSRCYMLF
jgi:ABC-type multidrug transport system ATPase subunit